MRLFASLRALASYWTAPAPSGDEPPRPLFYNGFQIQFFVSEQCDRCARAGNCPIKQNLASDSDFVRSVVSFDEATRATACRRFRPRLAIVRAS